VKLSGLSLSSLSVAGESGPIWVEFELTTSYSSNSSLGSVVQRTSTLSYRITLFLQQFRDRWPGSLQL
jgi:hypothetical protein